MKKILTIAGASIAVLVIFAGILGWRVVKRYMALETIQIDPQLTIILGAGGNSLILTAEDGSQALLVDTKMGRAVHRLKEGIQARAVTVVNTHLHRDHTGGNRLFPRARLIAGAYAPEQWRKATDNQRYPDLPLRAGDQIVLPIGSETVHIRNMGQGHSSNDVVVYLVKRKLLMSGDLVFLGMHPFIFPDAGSHIGNWIVSLDTLDGAYDLRTVVPGHGPISDRTALAAMKAYFTSIREALEDPRQLEGLRNKYARYFSVPGQTGFEKTRSVIERECTQR